MSEDIYEKQILQGKGKEIAGTSKGKWENLIKKGNINMERVDSTNSILIPRRPRVQQIRNFSKLASPPKVVLNHAA